jgi:hypothetical protein
LETVKHFFNPQSGAYKEVMYYRPKTDWFPGIRDEQPAIMCYAVVDSDKMAKRRTKMKKMFIVLIAGVALMGCGSLGGIMSDLGGGGAGNATAAEETVWDNPDVYVGGTIGVNSAAYYWKNGEQVVLKGGKRYASADVIAVSGNDVYVAGSEANDTGNWGICYWKNGEYAALTGGKTDAESTGIAVSGNDVYVAGKETSADGNDVLCYWQNSQKTALSDGKTKAAVRAIVLAGTR